MTKRIIRAKAGDPNRPSGRSGAGVEELLELLTDYGIDPQPLRDARIPGATRDRAWWQDTPHGEFARFFAGCIGALEREANLRDDRLPIKKTEFDMLCHCVVGCMSLRAAIARLITFTATLHAPNGSTPVGGERKCGNLRDGFTTRNPA